MMERGPERPRSIEGRAATGRPARIHRPRQRQARPVCGQELGGSWTGSPGRPAPPRAAVAAPAPRPPGWTSPPAVAAWQGAARCLDPPPAAGPPAGLGVGQVCCATRGRPRKARNWKQVLATLLDVVSHATPYASRPAHSPRRPRRPWLPPQRTHSCPGSRFRSWRPAALHEGCGGVPGRSGSASAPGPHRRSPAAALIHQHRRVKHDSTIRNLETSRPGRLAPQ